MGDRQTLYSYTYPGTHYQRPLYNRECYSCLGTPVAVASSDGGAYLAWNEGTWNPSNGSKNNDSEVYVSKINSNGEKQWSECLSLTGCDYNYNSAPAIVTLNNGTNCAVVWQSFTMSLEPPTQGRVYASKAFSNSDFTTPVEVGTEANAWSFDAVSTGSGVGIGWSNKSVGDWNIHAEKINF